MSVYFFDSSGLVKGYVQETGTAWVRSILGVSSNIVAVSRVTRVEVVSAFARKVRGGTLSAAEATSARNLFLSDFDDRFDVSELTPDLTLSAVEMVLKYSLRAYDAVQLANALPVDAYYQSISLGSLTFVASDRPLLAAAQSEGLAVDDPLNHP